MKKIFGYQDFINNAIGKCIKLNECNIKNSNNFKPCMSGFVSVHGPTGTGKTSALYRSNKEVKSVLEYIKSLDTPIPTIFCTHRWNILLDTYASVIGSKDGSGKPFSASIIYAQNEMVVSAVCRKPLPHEQGISETKIPDFMQVIQEFNKSKSLQNDKKEDVSKRLQKVCESIVTIVKKIDKLKLYIAFDMLAQLEDELKKQCSIVENLLLDCMRHLDNQVKFNEKEYGLGHQQTNNAYSALKKFRANAWIRRIFPAIVWCDEQQHILLLTTHKLFYSFYNGKEKVRMSSSALAGTIIFIDEFDYQADILQELLAQTQNIQEPAECVGQFLEGGKRLLARNAYPKNEHIKKIYDELQIIIDKLDEELEKFGIDLSRARTLVKTDKVNKFKEKFLFRSDHIVSSERHLRLLPKNGCFEVLGSDESAQIKQDDTQVVNFDTFLRLMEKYISRMSQFIAEFASQHDANASELVQEFHKLIFDSVNDYQQSVYSQVVAESALNIIPHINLPELDPLRRSNLLPNTQVNMNGLQAWLLSLDYSTSILDPDRVMIKRAYMPTTADGLMLELASRNLVFGLSATSYISRSFGHFDMRWIENALHYIAQARNPACQVSFLGNQFSTRPKEWFKKPIPYLANKEEKEEQQAVIQAIVKSKAEQRQTQLNVLIDDFEDDNLEVIDKHHLSTDFFETKPVKDDFNYKYRQKILMQLLHILQLATQSSQHKAHLVFVNSFKYLKKWLTVDSASASRDSATWFKLENPLGGKFEKCSKIFFPATVHSKKILICLLNAEAQKQTGFDEAYQAAFASKRTVIIITQTESASNGINLDYALPDSKQKMDITSLFILEIRHFFFTASDDPKGVMAHAGYQLRNLEKLVRNAEFSREQQRQNILAIMQNNEEEIKNLNNEYKKTADYIRFVAANVQQQVGRIERVWHHIPSVDIHLSNEIVRILQIYTEQIVYTNNKNLISTLNRELLEKIANIDVESGIKQGERIVTPRHNGAIAVESIDNMVEQIRLARQAGSDVDIKSLAQLWYEFGRAVLQFDLEWQPGVNAFGLNNEKLYRWACFERPEYFQYSEEIYYDQTTWQFFTKGGSGLIKYKMHELYAEIQHHHAIIEWFNRKGFRTSCRPFANEREAQFAFHPHVVQRILQGRLGEECIRALLDFESLKTTQTAYDATLFELYDFELSNKNVFIDAKFWSMATRNRFDNEYINWIAGGKNPQSEFAVFTEKLKKIREQRGCDAILVIANFISTTDCGLHGCNAELDRLDNVEQADIIFLEACVESQNHTLTHGFKQLINLIKLRKLGED